ncbi:VanZ family protein [Bacillus spongiae]|uniref:VanZ family protein n=1 Tax=Bacillus spongiae TaxID=2683610 RepID=A0ABU8HB06_9BACI
MDKTIESYVEEIVKELQCDRKEKKEIVDEISDHLNLLKQEYIEQGFLDEEASQKALESFGEKKTIRDGYKEFISPYYKLFKISSWVLFCIFSFVVIWKLLLGRIVERVINYQNGFPQNPYFFSFKEQRGLFTYDIDVWLSNVNIIPFKNIINYIVNNDRFNIDIILNNTLGNILIFIPLGLFLPILFRRYGSFSKVTAFSIMTSFSIEALQFSTQIGQFDIDDVILNSIGGIIGFLLVKLIVKFSSVAQKVDLKLN